MTLTLNFEIILLHPKPWSLITKPITTNINPDFYALKF
jgi:hypothetical protein